MIINRRIMLAGAVALAFTASASAEDWKAKYPELTFAVVPAENASGVTERWAPFIDYLSKELGVKVTCLHEGSVLAEGTIEQVSENERVVEVYLGR